MSQKRVKIPEQEFRFKLNFWRIFGSFNLFLLNLVFLAFLCHFGYFLAIKTSGNQIHIRRIEKLYFASEKWWWKLQEAQDQWNTKFFLSFTAFHISCLRFLNRFVETSRDTREKILIQTELEEAGFDLLPLKKMLLPQTSASIKDRNDLLQVRKNVFSVSGFHTYTYILTQISPCLSDLDFWNL